MHIMHNMLLIRAYAYELVVCIHARTYASYRDMHIMNTMHTSSYSTSCRQHGTRVHVCIIFFTRESIMYAYYSYYTWCMLILLV